MLHRATEAGDISLVQLLTLKADIEAKDPTWSNTPLFRAVLADKPAVVHLLLQKKAQADAPNKDNVTPLYQACAVGSRGVIELLLQARADVESKSSSLQTPLHAACLNGSTIAVELLLKYKADFNTVTRSGVNPLYMAAERGHIDIIQILAKANADLDAMTSDGITPLMRAAYKNQPAAVRLLVELKASVEKEAMSKTAAKWAKQEGHVAVFEFLQSKEKVEAPSLTILSEVKQVFLKFNLESEFLRGFNEEDVAKMISDDASLEETLTNQLKLKSRLNIGQNLALKNELRKLRVHLRSPANYEVGTVPIAELRSLDILTTSVGVGSQASVFPVSSWKPPGITDTAEQQFCIKRPNHHPESVKALEQEAQVWRWISPHPNVIHLAAIVRGPNNKFEGMLMIYHPLGSLDRLKLFRLHETDLIHSLKGLARALMHIHSLGLIHRDIASRNVLVSANKDFILCDFGMSRFGEVPLNGEEKLPWRSLPPEILKGRRLWAESQQSTSNTFFTESTDVWAFGVLLWEVANAKEAYSHVGISDIKLIQQKIEDGSITLPLEDTCLAYPRLAPALVGCLQRDPTRRPNARELVVLLGDNIEGVIGEQIRYVDTYYSRQCAPISVTTRTIIATTITTTTTATTTISSLQQHQGESHVVQQHESQQRDQHKHSQQAQKHEQKGTRRGSQARVPVFSVQEQALDVRGQVFSGAHADVFLAMCQPLNQQFAYKRLHNNAEAQKLLENEAAIWYHILPHSNIAQLKGVVHGPDDKMRGTLMEYYHLGSLDRCKNIARRQDVLLPGVKGLLKAILHLHGLGVIHRDIAKRNVFVAPKKMFILSNFGLSCVGQQCYVQDSRLPWQILAPEILKARRDPKQSSEPVFSWSSDMWAFGVLLWELCTGKDAYGEHANTKAVQQKIEEGRLKLPLKQVVSSFPRFAPVLLGCLQSDPTQRPNAAEALLFL